MLYLTGTKLISTIHFYKRWGGKHENTELEMTGFKASSYRPIVSSSQADNHHKEKFGLSNDDRVLFKCPAEL